MFEQSLYRAVIPPLSQEPRPLWSVMIPTYNCAEYLRETLAGVLAQDPGAAVMQIEVIDDCSTDDDPAAVVKELGEGRVVFYRQPQNVGYIRNFETCLQRSQGHLVHLLHGDDGVMPGFYRQMQQLFERHPEIGAGFCRHIIMDDNGHWKRFSRLEQSQSGVLDNWLERIAIELPLQPPSMVVRRSVYEALGGFDRRMASCGEDWEMWTRIAAHYPVGYEAEPLALYRDRSNSLTKRSVRTGRNIQDVRQATEITRAYLPPEKAQQLTAKAAEGWAQWAFHFSRQLAMQGDVVGAWVQLWEGLRCSRSLRTMRSTLPLVLKIAKQGLKRMIRPQRPIPHSSM